MSRALPLFLLACLAGACTRTPPADVVELKFMIWGDNEETATVRQFVLDFERANPGIKVQVQPNPSFGYREKLQIRIAGGDMPDVLYVGVEDFPDLAGRGVLMDLDPLAAADPGFVLEDYYADVLKHFRHEDKLLGIAKDFTTLVTYYNADIFDAWDERYPKKSWTRDDFLAKCKALTRDVDGDGRTDHYGFMVETWFGEWYPWVLAAGGQVWDADKGRFVLGDPEFIEANAEAIQFLRDLIWVHGVAPSPSVSAGQNGSSLFMNGKVAMCTYGRWACMQFKNIRDFEWDLAPFPRHKKKASTLFTVCYSIGAESRHPREAWRLVAWLTGKQGQTAVAESGLAVPVLKSVAESAHFRKPGVLSHLDIASKTYLDAIPWSQPAPRTPDWHEINLALGRSMESLFTSQVSPPVKEVLGRIQAQVEDILAHSRR